MLAVTVLGSILTLGIAGAVVAVIGVVEGVLYLTKSQGDFEQAYVFNKRKWFESRFFVSRVYYGKN